MLAAALIQRLMFRCFQRVKFRSYSAFWFTPVFCFGLFCSRVYSHSAWGSGLCWIHGDITPPPPPPQKKKKKERKKETAPVPSSHLACTSKHTSTPCAASRSLRLRAAAAAAARGFALQGELLHCTVACIRWRALPVHPNLRAP